MIILRSRSLIIPNDEYNLGNNYDTNTATRVFQLDRVMEGIDLANLAFKLDLTYADGTNDTLALDSEVTDDKINLTWTVTKNQLHVPGTVVVQIRALNVDGNMKWSSYIGAFFVEASLFGSADYTGKLSEIEQFEVAISSEKERVQNEKQRQDAEAERVQAEAERKSAEEERKTAESERKSAETARSNAESARDSAETEREEWYNAAKANFDAAVASGDKAEQIANSLESNVETNMKAAAASATAAAGSASAAAGSANEAKEYSQNWSALDQRVTKNANDIATTNNNLSNISNTVRVPTTITTGTDILKLDPGIYTYEDPNATNEQKLAMNFPAPVWHAEITVTGYWTGSDKTLGYLNIRVVDCSADPIKIYVNNYSWNEWKGWETYALKSDLAAKTPTFLEQYMTGEAQTLSATSTTTLWDSEITIPFDCIMIGNWKVLCKSSDANATFYYMVNNAYVQGRAQWDGTVQTDNTVNIFVMNKFTKGQKLGVSVQGNCSIRGANTSLTRYTFTFIPV